MEDTLAKQRYRNTGGLILSCVIVTLLLLAACEQTVQEPGEPPHGGAFLHAPPGTAPATQP